MTFFITVIIIAVAIAAVVWVVNHTKNRKEQERVREQQYRRVSQEKSEEVVRRMRVNQETYRARQQTEDDDGTDMPAFMSGTLYAGDPLYYGPADIPSDVLEDRDIDTSTPDSSNSDSSSSYDGSSYDSGSSSSDSGGSFDSSSY